MIIVFNGPLGVGKSTLAEALSERIDGCVMLDGDHLVAVNPPYHDEREHLHATIALMVGHHRRYGYRHFVIDHFWRTSEELADMTSRLVVFDADIRSFLLTLPADENRRRIERRASTRALDELSLDLETVAEERMTVSAAGRGSLGEPFDVSAAPAELVRRMLRQLRLAE